MEKPVPVSWSQVDPPLFPERVNHPEPKKEFISAGVSVLKKSYNLIGFQTVQIVTGSPTDQTDVRLRLDYLVGFPAPKIEWHDEGCGVATYGVMATVIVPNETEFVLSIMGSTEVIVRGVVSNRVKLYASGIGKLKIDESKLDEISQLDGSLEIANSLIGMVGYRSRFLANVDIAHTSMRSGKILCDHGSIWLHMCSVERKLFVSSNSAPIQVEGTEGDCSMTIQTISGTVALKTLSSVGTYSVQTETGNLMGEGPAHVDFTSKHGTNNYFQVRTKRGRTIRDEEL